MGDFNIYGVGLFAVETILPVFGLQYGLYQLCGQQRLLSDGAGIGLPESGQQFAVARQSRRWLILPAIAKFVECGVVQNRSAGAFAELTPDGSYPPSVGSHG